jgi:hypothetical protein
MKNVVKVASIISLLIILLLQCNLAQSATSSCIVDDRERHELRDPAIALDSKDNPHIMYWDNIFGSLYYASWNGTGWNRQSIGVGGMPNLAFDAQDNLHVSYGNVYAIWDGEKWSTQTIENYVAFPFLKLDAQGTPHTSYHSLNQIKYASLEGSTWKIQTIDVNINSFCSSLALNSKGALFVSYWDNKEDKGGLKCAKWTGINWDIQTVDSLVDYSVNALISPMSLALDDTGNPHICYIGDTGLKYASWNGTNWNTQTVAQNGGGGSLVFDVNGIAHICFTDHSDMGNWEIKYASWAGNEWNIQNITNGTSNTRSLAIDSKGNANIAYSPSYDNSIMYTYFDAASVTPTPTPTATENVTPTSPTVTPFYIVVGAVCIVLVLAVLLRQKRKKD